MAGCALARAGTMDLRSLREGMALVSACPPCGIAISSASRRLRGARAGRQSPDQPGGGAAGQGEDGGGGAARAEVSGRGRGHVEVNGRSIACGCFSIAERRDHTIAWAVFASTVTV